MNTSENGNGGGPAKKPTVHAGPSRRFTLADVAAVATGAALLEIEPAALEALPSVPPDASAGAMVGDWGWGCGFGCGTWVGSIDPPE